ncbi:MAG: glucokinase, partial [Pseudoxanthomonas sp.]
MIVADVGGTYARVGLVQIARGRAPEILSFHRYACGEHPSLAAILRDFADREVASGRPQHAIVA